MEPNVNIVEDRSWGAPGNPTGLQVPMGSDPKDQLRYLAASSTLWIIWHHIGEEGHA